MFNLELSLKCKSSSLEFGYPTLIWLQDFLNIENSFFQVKLPFIQSIFYSSKHALLLPEKTYLTCKGVSEIQESTLIGLLRFNTTQVSVNYTKKRTKIFQTFFLLWLLLLLSHIHLLQLLSCSNLLQEA